MRFKFVIRQLGLLLVMISASMLPSACWSLYDMFRHGERLPGGEEAAVVLLGSAGIGAALGAALMLLGRAGGKQLGRREALLLVALSWTVGAALAAMPFRLWALFHDFGTGGHHPFESYINCYFEAMSGLTTTGASILTDIEAVPRSLLFWRSFTQWLGGLGIVVLFVAVLPILGVGGKRLYQFEAPGPQKEGVRPRIRAAAQMLWIIYLGLTVAETLALRFIAGIGWLDAMCHAFSTLATGGFSTDNASIAGFHNWKMELIIIVFMFLAGVNFGLYDQLISGRWRSVLKNPELRAYALIILCSFVVIAGLNLGQEIVTTARDRSGSPTALARHTLFTVISMQTTTGFCTADFDGWPFPARVLLFGLMFVGGCGGSTAGGIKVIRFVILAKVIWAELHSVLRPHVVRTVRVGRSSIDPQLRSQTMVYFLIMATIFLVASGLVLWLESPRTIKHYHGGDPAATAFGAVAATLNNIGPGFDLVGPSRNYAWFSKPTKLVLTGLMALGRLELYAFLVLLLPSFWREE